MIFESSSSFVGYRQMQKSGQYDALEARLPRINEELIFLIFSEIIAEGSGYLCLVHNSISTLIFHLADVFRSFTHSSYQIEKRIRLPKVTNIIFKLAPEVFKLTRL